MLKLILLDQDREFMNRLIAHEGGIAKFNVIGAASDGATALDMLRSDTIDIALIDMEMPNKDGQYVLDAMAVAPGHKPVFILFHSSKMSHKVSEGRPNYFMPKPSSMDQLVTEIEKIWEAKAKKAPFRKKHDLYNNDFATDIMPLLPRKPIKKEPKLFIRELLHRIGAPAHLRGSAYLQTAFLLIVDDGKCRFGDLMNHIYPAVAKLHHTTAVQVERGIRYMVTRTMEKGRDLIVTNYLGIPMISPGKRLTNSELLTALAYCYFRDNEQ